MCLVSRDLKIKYHLCRELCLLVSRGCEFLHGYRNLSGYISMALLTGRISRCKEMVVFFIGQQWLDRSTGSRSFLSKD